MTEVIKTHKCPICHKLCADDRYAPFCSKRCADIDLGRWFNGDYSVPSQSLDEMETIELYEALEHDEQSTDK